MTMEAELLDLELEEEEDEDELMMLMSLAVNMFGEKRTHRFWVHEINSDRKTHGTFFHLVPNIDRHEDKFKEYFRLTRQQFAQLLSFVEPHLKKRNRAREVICPRERLAICVRFLATGESFRSLAFSYKIGKQSVSCIVEEVCQVIWQELAPRFMKMPETENDWKAIATNFERKWNFPNCIGSIDGKHVLMQAPSNSGSLYYNYKGTFSVVLLALVDANLKFINIDVGAYGRNSDRGIFSHSNLGKALADDQLNVPKGGTLPRADHLAGMPYTVVGDEAFPLKTYLMRPFPGKNCSCEQKTFNYRLSRARRIVENAFGVLAARWRVFHTKMAVREKLVRKIVKAVCCLHNMVQRESTRTQTRALIQDSRNDPAGGISGLQGAGNRGGKAAEKVRNDFADYFVNVDPVEWQHRRVTRGQFS